MKSIPVGPHHQAIVDDEDFEELARHRWYLTNGRYAIRHARKSDGKRAVVKMHIQIIGHPPLGKVTDHIDGNGLNNQRNNLRHITYRANTQNRFSFMSSRFPGISWEEDPVTRTDSTGCRLVGLAAQWVREKGGIQNG